MPSHLIDYSYGVLNPICPPMPPLQERPKESTDYPGFYDFSADGLGDVDAFLNSLSSEPSNEVSTIHQNAEGSSSTEPQGPILNQGPPPPQILRGIFPSRKSLQTTLQTWATSHNFGIVIQGSSPDRLKLGCVCGGKYRAAKSKAILAAEASTNLDPSKKTYRRNKTLRINCPFVINCHSIRRKDPDDFRKMIRSDQWRINHSVINNFTHNHSKLDTDSFPVLRRLDERIENVLLGFLRQGITPRGALKRLNEAFPEAKVGFKDVCNLKNRDRVRRRTEAARRRAEAGQGESGQPPSGGLGTGDGNGDGDGDGNGDGDEDEDEDEMDTDSDASGSTIQAEGSLSMNEIIAL